jgi:restriction system protein
MARGKGHAEFVQWMGPLLDALRAMGGSAAPRECSDWIAEHHHLPETVTDSRIKSGAERFHNQVPWARQYLVWEGLLDPTRRGVWTLTPKGAATHLSDEESRRLFLKWVEIHAERRKESTGGAGGSPVDVASEAPEKAEENELLTVLQGLSADGFEKLCKRLLHEYGLERVVVTGKSHDGGIDGRGVLRLNPFVTMKVLFQCKKVRNAVSRAQVGDFRNAVMGRADKGILITTGWFSSDAEKEANREGVIPIEMVDGERLVELFEAKQLGLRRTEAFEVDHTFFDQFR